jgi:hypothetical protein
MFNRIVRKNSAQMQNVELKFQLIINTAIAHLGSMLLGSCSDMLLGTCCIM